MPNYNPLVPTGSVPLNLDYKNLQGNFAKLDTVYATDHVPLTDGTANSGYHKVVHLVPNTGTATPVVGIGELYSQLINDGYATDTNLFYQTGTGRNYQMTCNFTPQRGSGSNNAGFTFIPAAIVMQWGVVDGTHSGSFNDGDTGTVLFATNNLDFSTKLVNVQITLEYDTSAPGGRANVVVDQASFATTGFNWVFLSGGSSSYTRFNWLAIGF